MHLDCQIRIHCVFSTDEGYLERIRSMTDPLKAAPRPSSEHHAAVIQLRAGLAQGSFLLNLVRHSIAFLVSESTPNTPNRKKVVLVGFGGSEQGLWGAQERKVLTARI